MAEDLSISLYEGKYEPHGRKQALAAEELELDKASEKAFIRWYVMPSADVMPMPQDLTFKARDEREDPLPVYPTNQQ